MSANRKSKFKGLRGLIAETMDFRGGSIDGQYLDSRLARALKALLDERDAQTEYEYGIMWVPSDAPSYTELHRSGMTEGQADNWLTSEAAVTQNSMDMSVFRKYRRPIQTGLWEEVK